MKEKPSDFSSWTCLLQLVEQKVGGEGRAMRPRRYFFVFVYICLFVLRASWIQFVRCLMHFWGCIRTVTATGRNMLTLRGSILATTQPDRWVTPPPLTCLVALCLVLRTRLPPPHTCTPTHPHTLSCILATYYNYTAVGRLTPLPNPNYKDIEMSLYTSSPDQHELH